MEYFKLIVANNRSNFHIFTLKHENFMTKMKWLPLLLFALTLGFSSANAQTPAGGVETFHGTLQEALNKAKAENKLLFVDSYTVWCGPCKWFSANVLTNPEVAALYNKNFINFKMDTEKGEGPAFAQKYGVMQIPTLIFLDGTGKVVSKQVGALQVPAFLDWGRQMSEYKL
jgi:thioredoxin 1